MQVQGNGKFSISCVGAFVFVCVEVFQRAFASAFAYVCVARVNQPYELFYSAGVTNSIY